MIDVHVHMTPPEISSHKADYFNGETALGPLYGDPKAKMADETDILAMMDQEGVKTSLVMGLPWANEETAKRHNYWLLETAQKNSGRLKALAAFNPSAPWAIKHAEEMLKAGMFGLGELAIYDRGFTAEDLDKLEELGGLCRQYNAPLLMHVNEPIGHQYPGKAPLEISQIFALVRRCQGVKLILAHFGGGLPLLAALKKEVANYLDMVIFDTAAMPYLFQPQAFKMALMVLGPNHFALGTDYPLLKPARYLKMFQEAGLSPDETAALTGGASRRLLGL